MSKATPEELFLVELRAQRRKVDRLDDERQKLNALYVKGDRMGITAAAMARAMYPNSDDTTYVAESVRQIIGRITGRRAPRKRARSAA